MAVTIRIAQARLWKSMFGLSPFPALAPCQYAPSTCRFNHWKDHTGDLRGRKKQPAEIQLEQDLIHKHPVSGLDGGYAFWRHAVAAGSVIPGSCSLSLLGMKEQRLGRWACRQDWGCMCMCGLCWQEFWVLFSWKCDGSVGDWYQWSACERKGLL